MNNRTTTRIFTLFKNAFEKFTDILLPKEEKVRQLEELGVAGLFDNIPRAENFDLPKQAGFDTTKIKNYRCPKELPPFEYKHRQLFIFFVLITVVKT